MSQCTAKFKQKVTFPSLLDSNFAGSFSQLSVRFLNSFLLCDNPLSRDVQHGARGGRGRERQRTQGRLLLVRQRRMPQVDKQHDPHLVTLVPHLRYKDLQILTIQ